VAAAVSLAAGVMALRMDRLIPAGARRTATVATS